MRREPGRRGSVVLLAAGGYASLDVVRPSCPASSRLTTPPDRSTPRRPDPPGHAPAEPDPGRRRPLAEAAAGHAAAGRRRAGPAAGPARAWPGSLAPGAAPTRAWPRPRRDGPRRRAPAQHLLDRDARPARHPGLDDQAAHRRRGRGHAGPAGCTLDARGPSQARPLARRGPRRPAGTRCWPPAAARPRPWPGAPGWTTWPGRPPRP